MDVVAAGHICLDIIPDWNKGGINSIIPGHIVEMDGIQFSTGGAVANTGLSLIKLGIDTQLVGKIGNDVVGSIIRDILNKQNCDSIKNMIVSEDETSSYTVVLNPPDTDRIFLHSPGTNHTFRADDIPFNQITDAKIFHFGYPPLMEEFYSNNGSQMAEVFKKIGVQETITSLDLAMPDPNSPAGKLNWCKFFKNVLPHVDIFLPSIDELTYMLHKKEDDWLTPEGDVKINVLNEIGNKLLEYGPGMVVIKLGDKGLYLQVSDIKKDSNLNKLIDIDKWINCQLLSPCFKANVAGTTGSGDATIAGFLAGLLTGSEPAEVLNTATAVGACSVEAVDAIGGIIPLEKVYQKLRAGWEKLSINLAGKDWIYDEINKVWKKESE